MSGTSIIAQISMSLRHLLQQGISELVFYGDLFYKF